MLEKLPYFFVLWAVVCDSSQANQLTVSVIYKPIELDSIKFVTEQLFPAYKRLGQLLRVELVPYPKILTKSNGTSTSKYKRFSEHFMENYPLHIILKTCVEKMKKHETNKATEKLNLTCEADSRECFATVIHACVLNMYSPEESSQFINCSMGSMDYSFDGSFIECSREAGIVWNDIKMCHKSGQYQKLLKQLTNRIVPLERSLKSFPTVLINNKFDQTEQDEAKFNFKRLICQLVINEPEYCKEEETELGIGKTEEEE